MLERVLHRAESRQRFLPLKVVSRPIRLALPLLPFVIALTTASLGRAATLAEAETLFKKGDYAACLAAATEGARDNRWLEDWWMLKIRAELATGRYADALATYTESQRLHALSLPVRWLGYEVLTRNGRRADALETLRSIEDLADRLPRRLEEVSARVAAGRAKLAAGGDAKQVLEDYLDPAKALDTASPLPPLAIGELALSKGDFALAAESYAEAAKLDPEDPEPQLGLARAFAESDSEQAGKALQAALQLNPRHVDSLLFQADNLIDREAYGPADAVLKEASAVNAEHPLLWAYWAVLAHLNGDDSNETRCREKALERWPTDPAVDHLIGLKLSQRYRFAEGAKYQRQSLASDASYFPATLQLAQDLLRLGDTDEGFALAVKARAADPYNVIAYNLVALQEALTAFKRIDTPHFRLRMEPGEADIYGERAARLLEKARQELPARYGVSVDGPVSVEIFPKQSDFAIRTFGLPGGSGYLGVCFGPVITVNSPASRMGRPANWEAVLWHEYCHTVTLAKTRNKMPRWLSEGISVYEELRQNPGWGQTMTPSYRELILDGGATPVSALSGAFLRPPSPMHLQFAYYESSMVVRYVVERFGDAALNRVLDDLAADVPINAALAKHTEPIEALDEHFADWLSEQAKALGTPDTDWTRPDLPLDADSTVMAGYLAEHPDNFYGQLGLGRALVAERQFERALEPLKKAASLYPECDQPGGPYLLLAAAYRGLGKTEDEQAMLAKHAALDGDAVEARQRLAEIAEAGGDWPQVRQWAEQIIAINPLTPRPHHWLARAAEASGDRLAAVEAYQTLLRLDPLNAAEHHYRLAKMLVEMKQPAVARNHLLRALEAAPRYRAAYALLLEVADTTPDADKGRQPKR